MPLLIREIDTPCLLRRLRSVITEILHVIQAFKNVSDKKVVSLLDHLVD